MEAKLHKWMIMRERKQNRFLDKRIPDDFTEAEYEKLNQFVTEKLQGNYPQ